ncbi:hypothetical protein HPS56_05975 [Prevotella sp. PMUR]|uniref:Uncharacterized protein n=2 Tax=Xylanibacter muris TaxID=2736290 RepID=A0ABX2AM10_9BACT|nr:DUF6029 family protein [Xylanibacter muris]NPD91903.1 hypothetical protein [Xylanibacter muris]
MSLLFLSVTASAVMAQDDKITLSGSIQSDILLPEEDNKIKTDKYKDDVLTNTFVDLNLNSRYVDAGARLEYLEHPLPGFEKDYAGWGVPYMYLKVKLKDVDVTVGNFYEQFGSGFILRTYEERSLGVDNSLLGGRIVAKPFKGVTMKALSGRQRRYWDLNKPWITGGDVELGLDEWIRPLQSTGTYITLGASYVMKHESSEYRPAPEKFYRLNLPENVEAYDFRVRLQKGGLNVLAEYARKSQDPSADNHYIYRKGSVAMLSASYSKKGVSMLLQAKRSDNMSFRSERSITGTSSFINHLPAFTMDHTYALAALYPYATKPDGEWAYQAELGYNFKKNTLLGGKYGTKVKANFSYIRALDKNYRAGYTEGSDKVSVLNGTDGYGSAFWKWGNERYYQDFNVQVEKKMSKSFKLNLMYMNQFYNKTAVEGKGGMIHSNIFIADGKYRFNNMFTLRGEAQYLTTADDERDWAFGLLELSVLPHFMITVSDMYNVGVTDIHYYQGYVTYTAGAHRLQIGYGRTRAGYNCSGGVCRFIPATKGFTVSYNYNF